MSESYEKVTDEPINQMPRARVIRNPDGTVIRLPFRPNGTRNRDYGSSFAHFPISHLNADEIYSAFFDKGQPSNGLGPSGPVPEITPDTTQNQSLMDFQSSSLEESS